MKLTNVGGSSTSYAFILRQFYRKHQKNRIEVNFNPSPNPPFHSKAFRDHIALIVPQ